MIDCATSSAEDMAKEIRRTRGKHETRSSSIFLCFAP